MDATSYEYFDRQVERKMKWAEGCWFRVGWSQMVDVCDDKVNAGTLEKRFNQQDGKLEFRAIT